MAKCTNRGRSSEPSARSPRSRERQVRGCVVAALPGMRLRARRGGPAQLSGTRHETTEMITPSSPSSRPAFPAAGPMHLSWDLIQATDWGLPHATDWSLRQTTGRNNIRQATELTPS